MIKARPLQSAIFGCAVAFVPAPKLTMLMVDLEVPLFLPVGLLPNFRFCLNAHDILWCTSSFSSISFNSSNVEFLKCGFFISSTSILLFR